MKKKYLVILILTTYFFGLITVDFKIFPYKYLIQIKHFSKELISEINSSDKKSKEIKEFTYSTPNPNRDRNTTIHASINITKHHEPKNYVTYGQSNSVNSSQIGYEVSNPVFMFFEGKTFKYKDPALGGTGGNGSVWGRVGDKLIESGSADHIIFAVSGWGGSSIQELTYGHQFNFLKDQILSIKNKYGKVDGILFHQGESNHIQFKGSIDYERDFLSMFEKIRELTDAPIFLSQTSICDSQSDIDLLLIQNKIIESYKGILRGPNSDLIDANSKFRLPDRCHFSSAGLDKLSSMWVDAILNKSEY